MKLNDTQVRAFMRLTENNDYLILRATIREELERLTDDALRDAKEHTCGSAFALRWMLKLVDDAEKFLEKRRSNPAVL